MDLKKSLLLAIRVFAFFLSLGVIARLGIGFFSSFDLNLKNDLAVFLWGIQFDLAAAGFFTIIWSLFAIPIHSWLKLQKIWLGFLGFYYLFVSSSDYVYVLESGRHLGYEVRNLTSIQGSLINLLIKYSPYILISAMTSVLVFWIFRFLSSDFFTLSLEKAQQKPGIEGHGDRSAQYLNQAQRIGKKFLIFFLILVPSFICVRGFRGIPLDPSYSYRAGGVREASIALNPVYSIVYSSLSGYQAIPEQIIVPEGLDTQKIFAEWRNSRGVRAPQENSQNNLIIIFLEGWPASREIPQFRKFQNEESLRVKRMLSLGQRTVEGIFASLCSWPNPLGRGIMFSQLENFNYDCLPQKFSERGYHTAFFQGSDQLTSGVGPLTQKLGFQNSYGKTDLPGALKKELNFWGLFDHDLYQYVLENIQSHPEPFLIGINTNTTHDLKLPAGVQAQFGFETQLQQHQSVMWHADQELHLFLQKLKALKTKNPITVVLISDHTSYYSAGYLDQYSIPFAISGSEVPIREKNQISSQKDVAATLADLFGIPAPHYLGQSLLRDEPQTGILLYHLGSAVWIEGQIAVVFNARVPNQWKCYNAEVDPDLKNEILCPETSQAMYARGISYLVETQKHIFQGTTSEPN